MKSKLIVLVIMSISGQNLFSSQALDQNDLVPFQNIRYLDAKLNESQEQAGFQEQLWCALAAKKGILTIPNDSIWGIARFKDDILIFGFDKKELGSFSLSKAIEMV